MLRRLHAFMARPTAARRRPVRRPALRGPRLVSEPDAAEAVDVRPVAPECRCGTVLSAFRRLALGERLTLTVDRDPECVYDALLAEAGAAGFTFQYLERGPEAWRVVLTCRCP